MTTFVTVIVVVVLGVVIGGVVVDGEQDGRKGSSIVASVSPAVGTAGYWVVWEDERTGGHGESPEYDTIGEAVEWARARADLVFVRLGAKSPRFFSAGSRYDPGDDPQHPLPVWPPEADELKRLLADNVPPTWDQRQRTFASEEGEP